MADQSSNVIAIYGAVLSTAVAGWNFYQWWMRGPKLIGSASSNMVTFGGVPHDANTYCVLRVSNRGDASTTITNLGLLGYKNWRDYFFRKQARAAVINGGGLGNPIPFQLMPGSEYSGFAIQNADLEQWSRDHLLFICVWHTMSNKPLRVRLGPIIQGEGGNV